MTTEATIRTEAARLGIRLDVRTQPHPRWCMVRAWLPSGFVTPNGLLHSRTVYQSPDRETPDWSLVLAEIRSMDRNKTPCRKPSCLFCRSET